MSNRDNERIARAVIERVSDLRVKVFLVDAMMDRFRALEIKRQDDDMTSKEYEEYIELHSDSQQATMEMVKKWCDLLEDSQKVMESQYQQLTEYKQELESQREEIKLLKDELQQASEDRFQLCLYDWYLEDKGLAEDYKTWENALDEGE